LQREDHAVRDDDPARVLIVDDDAAAATVLGRHLREAGYGVRATRNGAEALRLLINEDISIVVTDWVMPDMDGLELCRVIRAHEGIPFAYVIIMSASRTSDDQLVEAFGAGADDFVRKPYSVKEVLARIRAGERIMKLQRELRSRNREVHRYNAELEVAYRKLAAANRELNRMATTDELTGLLNRREAMIRLEDCWAASERHGDSLACIVLDIDHFKHCNDAHGHGVGDAVLKSTAAVLHDVGRRGEPVCRIGGEEFLVICPQSTEAMVAKGAERLRRAVEDHAITCGQLTVRVTISAGVAERNSTMNSPDDLLRAADAALYAAKDAGRNVVRLASAARARPPRQTR
jgi:diguanylate cyclase (GGDEF)-like protein